MCSEQESTGLFVHIASSGSSRRSPRLTLCDKGKCKETPEHRQAGRILMLHKRCLSSSPTTDYRPGAADVLGIEAKRILTHAVHPNFSLCGQLSWMPTMLASYVLTVISKIACAFGSGIRGSTACSIADLTWTPTMECNTAPAPSSTYANWKPANANRGSYTSNATPLSALGKHAPGSPAAHTASPAST